MLQPAELLEVTQRFAGEIFGLRRFLARAAIPLESERTARVIATRLTGNPGFHRDLTSHVWALLDERGSEIKSAELLAIVMLAALGSEGATETGEEDAHTILRFLIKARHTFLEGNALVEAEDKTAAIRRADGARSTPFEPAPQSVLRSTQQLRTSSPNTEVPPTALGRAAAPFEEGNGSGNRRQTTFIAGATVAVALLLLLGTWLLTKSNGTAKKGDKASGSAAWNTPGSAVPPISENSERGGETILSMPMPMQQAQRRQTAASAISHDGITHHSISAASTRAGVATVERAGSTAMPAVKSREPGSTSVFPSTMSPSLTHSDSTNAVPIIRSTPPNAPASTTVSADTLSRRLDSPRFPDYGPDADDPGRNKHPRLLHRNGNSGYDETGSEPTLAADLHAPNLGPATGPSRNSSAVRGLVRSTCLGMMAANLIYGPTPPYPAVAASAHVQGEVKIQANIDRDGTVNAARVVSGPPLLRDAALEAVQHWRYKPFTSGGKTRPTGALAVLEFELP